MQSQISLPPAGISPEDSIKRNQAAIALAEAMSRARELARVVDVPRASSKALKAARLETVRQQLAPLYAAIPRDVELFDLALVSSDKPKLFVDIIAFIELTPDDTFRFVQDTRTGRTVLLETDDETTLRDAVTDYIARRLIERERALAATVPVDAPVAPAGIAKPDSIERPMRSDEPRPVADAQAAPAVSAAPFAALPQTMAKAASPAMPQDANQAFERWTNALAQPDTGSGTEQRTDAAPSARGIQQSPVRTNATAEEELAAVRRELVEITALTPSVTPEAPKPPIAPEIPAVPSAHIKEPRIATVSSVQVKEPVVGPAPLAQMVQAAQPAAGMIANGTTAKTTAVAATAAATTASVIRTPYAPRPETHSGRWLLPLLALLVGIGLGALLLYLYAANILKP
jgi:hypothetical protein